MDVTRIERRHRVAIVATHPVQYNAPWFAILSQQPGIEVMVFYTWSQSKKGAKYDPDFKRIVEWDVPLLDGYESKFVENVAKDPGSHHFNGIKNPTLNREVEAWQPDAVLVIGWAYKSHFSCMRYFKGKVPVLFRGDSTLLDETPGVKRIIRRLWLKYVYSYVDLALYTGRNNKDYFITHGLKDSQLVFAPHAVDNQRFGGAVNSIDHENKWRKQLGIAPDEIIFLFAGKLEPKKDPGFLIHTFCETGLNHAHLVLVGNGMMD